MPGFNTEKKNFISVHEMVKSIISDMKDNGFDLIFPASGLVADLDSSNYAFDECGNAIPPAANRPRWAAILKPDATVNSLATTQDWVIKFEWDSAKVSDNAAATLDDNYDGKLDIFVCTPLQVHLDTGKHTWFTAKFNKITSKSVSIGLANQGDEGEDYLESLGMCGTNFSFKSLVGANMSANQTYYNTSEVEDVSGYDKDLATDSFSFPAALRNKHSMAKHFWYRSHIKDSEAAAFPMSYNISITPRGFFLSIWEQTSDDVGNRNSWILVQRPVDHVSGTEYATGKAPVHCIYQTMTKYAHRPWIQAEQNRTIVGTSGTPPASLNIMSPKAVNIRRFIVREQDIEAPYPTPRYVKDAFGVRMDYAEGGFPFGVDATEHSVDYAAVINTKQQVAITENNKYVITFPNGFNTARYAYTHELDMIAYTSADVISADTEISITVYGEATPRIYKALQANGPNNSGGRILVLKSGGGIT